MGQIDKALTTIQGAIEAVIEVDTGSPNALYVAEKALTEGKEMIENFALSQYGMEPEDLKTYRGVKK